MPPCAFSPFAHLQEGCAKISQRDVALLVWDAMVEGAFKLFARYLHLPVEACLPSTAGWTATVTAQAIRWFTALVVVWYAVSFAKAWYQRVRAETRATFSAIYVEFGACLACKGPRP